MQGDILGAKEDHVAYAREKIGFGYMRIKRTDLMDVMMEAVQKAGIPIHFNKRLSAIEEYEREKVTAIFSDGTVDTADFLLGCDGSHSQVRHLYVDPDQTPEYTGFSGLFSIIPASSLDPTAAAQLSGFDVTLTEKGMFMALHCTATADQVLWGFSRQVSLPESGDSRDGWETHRKKEVEGFKSNMRKILTNAHGEWGAAMKQIVDRTEVVQFYPVHKLPLRRAWSKGRCLLVGDAAHAMSPHAGQGVSMALEDAFLIARLLKDSARIPSEICKKYDQIRRPRVTEIFGIATQNANMRKNTGPWGLWAKEVAFKVVFWVPSALGLDKFGFGQKHLVYDIDEEVL